MRLGLMPVPLITALLACPGPSIARLYDNETASEIRYGKGEETINDKTSPLLPGAQHRTYKYQGWQIRAAFLNGKTVMIQYMKAGAPGGPTIQDDEVAAILAGEANGGTWEKVSTASLNPIKQLNNIMVKPEMWKNTNNSLGYFRGGRYILVFETPAAEAYRKAQAAEKERQRKTAIPKF